MSASGILAYGYNLGGGDGWEIAETGEYGELALDWFDPEDEDTDFVTEAEKRLLVAAGFTETDWRADGYFAREREAKAALGVRFESYCSGDYSQYALATKVITVSWGEVEQIDMVELVEAPNVHGWDDKLRAALETLGLTPKQESPRWLLCSYWG
jgi:hypothetical protein